MKSGSIFRQLIAETEKHLQSCKTRRFLPISIFAPTNSDDIALFSPKMLSEIALFGGSEIDNWSGRAAKINITSLPGIEVDGKPTSVISVTSINKPFIYDSIIAEVTSGARQIHMTLHPIISKDDEDNLKLYRADEKQTTHQTDKNADQRQISHIQIYLPRLSKTDAESFKKRINHVLTQVNHAVQDWKPMLAKLDEVMTDIENIPDAKDAQNRQEVIAFLKWLKDRNFTFLGIREYIYSGKTKKLKIKHDGKSGLGILSDPDIAVLRLGKNVVISNPEIIEFLESKDHLIVTKANMRSIVHRRTYMDYIGVKRYNSKGEVCGEIRIIGLFTSSSYTSSVLNIPLLRAKAGKIVSKFGFDEESHSGKSLLNTLESYPRDELFQIDEKLLYEFCVQTNDLEDRPRIRVLPRIDRFDRYVSIIIYVPRYQYNSIVRQKIGVYLCSIYGDRVSAYYPAFPDENIARIHFIIGRSGGKTPHVEQKVLELNILEIVTRWEDKFAELAGEGKNRISVNQSYQEHFSAKESFADLENLIACSNPEQMRITFLKRDSDRTRGGDLNNQLSMKIFHSRDPLNLSRRVPLLENSGFGVRSEQTYQISVKDEKDQFQPVIIHDMELSLPEGNNLSLEKDHDRLEQAFKAVWNGEIDNDLFNRLVTNSELTIHEVKVLRVYARYLRQTGITYSQKYMADCLVRYPLITHDLFKLFHNRFDPKLGDKKRHDEQAKILDDINKALQDVPALDDDRIIKRFTNAILSTLRSNYFQLMQNGHRNPVLAFKFNPRELDGLPQPVPFREIFVYGADVEGVHLRFGPIARGGLRWSDRAEDYRTEVLGLVKAQQVKNAVIVPVGSKGVFYPKKLPVDGDRDAFIHAGREAYKLFISTMLSITDNLDGDKVIRPQQTVCHDGDDPYFVVAADKGTATFSDTANAISQAHGFWLDDAFASGGSDGYDHKKMGITAKGGWEAVKRHFREMNIDIQSEPFTVAGVGDMSGDVFGNGMLLSEKIRLVAAFDHRDIFIDPNPDCVTSFAERKRLFQLDRSSWQSYNQELLSKGGMIISRQQKAVDLTREAAQLLQMDGKNVSPYQVLTAILKAQVDLLWFGGIGTYIRDDRESDTDVGDRANDPIRIPAKEVRAKVIGEGANLGITQKARITYAARGGRCNNDAIDNSAGVNSSDVEVNIKIALANAMREDRLTIPKRNRLLSSMTNDVSKLVLRNNYLQTLAISLVEQQGVSVGGELARLMSTLEADGLLNRVVEMLPDDATLQERLANGKSLTRPEISVLLSYAKIILFDDVIKSKLPDEAYFNDTLVNYFPKKMLAAHKQDIKIHRLRREIISTLTINDVINRGGPSVIIQMQDKTGASPEDVVKAYILVRDGLSFNSIFNSVDALDNKIDGSLQNQLYQDVCKALIKTISWALKTNAINDELAISVPELQRACDELSPDIGQYLPAFMRQHIEESYHKLVAQSVPKKLAKQIAELEFSILMPQINQISTLSQTSLDKTASVFFLVTRLLKIGRILNAADNIVVSSHYDRLALSRNLDEISEARRNLVMSALTDYDADETPEEGWEIQNNVRITRVKDQISNLIDVGEVSVAKLTIAAGLITDLSRE